MTLDDIIRMALEAKIPSNVVDIWFGQISDFAALVAAATKEQCAKVCEDLGYKYENCDVWDCAEAIRNRGNKPYDFWDAKGVPAALREAVPLAIKAAVEAEREAIERLCVEIAERDFWCVGDILTAIRARGSAGTLPVYVAPDSVTDGECAGDSVNRICKHNR